MSDFMAVTYAEVLGGGKKHVNKYIEESKYIKYTVYHILI